MAANMMWSTVETNMAVFSGGQEPEFVLFLKADRTCSLSTHASTHFPPLPTWTINDRRISSGTDKPSKRGATSYNNNTHAIEEAGISKVWPLWST
jgi:hypothetical protein